MLDWLRTAGPGVALVSVLGVLAVFSGCGGSDTEDPVKDVPGPVQNLEIVGYEHTGLLLRWEEPVLGSPIIEGYKVYFQIGVTDPAVLIGTTTGTTLIHTPYDSERGGWVNGTYLVRAYNGEGQGEEESQSTTPTHSPCYLYELDYNLEYPTGVHAGLYFNRADGTAITLSVNSTHNSRNAELYLTDLTAGCCGPEGFYLCSLAYGSYESADKDHIDDFAGELEDCKFYDTDTPEYFPVVVNKVTSSVYSESLPLNGNYISVHTHDDHYAVIRVSGEIDLSGDPVQMDCWFQKIPSFGVLAP